MWGDRRVKPLCWLFKHSTKGEHIYRSRFSDKPISHDPAVSTFFKSVASRRFPSRPPPQMSVPPAAMASSIHP